MAGIAQLEWGNSQLPLSKRLLVLNIETPPNSNSTTPEPRELDVVPPKAFFRLQCDLWDTATVLRGVLS
jgi:hypothetical protein